MSIQVVSGDSHQGQGVLEVWVQVEMGGMARSGAKRRPVCEGRLRRNALLPRKVPELSREGPLDRWPLMPWPLPLQTSKAVFVAPPKASTSLSSHGRMLPNSGPVQLAMPRTWAGVRTWSQRLNWAMSPTKAWVASKRPPRCILDQKAERNKKDTE